jgi:hypothetical protein
MSLDNLGWLLPAWLIGVPLLIGLYERATNGSLRTRPPTELRSNVDGRQ